MKLAFGNASYGDQKGKAQSIAIAKGDLTVRDFYATFIGNSIVYQEE